MTSARKLIDSFGPDDGLLLASGFDTALIGVVEGWFAAGWRLVALYDVEQCVRILTRDGLDEEEAREFVQVNLTGAYVGEGTPAFATIYRRPIICPLPD